MRYLGNTFDVGYIAVGIAQTLDIYQPDLSTGARAVPIYATTSYVFQDSQQAADRFALKEEGNIYIFVINLHLKRRT